MRAPLETEFWACAKRGALFFVEEPTNVPLEKDDLLAQAALIILKL
jgi:hypothetical protein